MGIKIDLEKMEESAQEACKFLKILSNTDRLLLLCHISQAEKCVGELEEALDIHQPTLSQQLTVLRKEGFVQTRRDGKQIYYSLKNTVALHVMDVLLKNYCI